MRWLVNNESGDGMWKTVKIFTLIPRKCYDSKTMMEFIVWLEYINRHYKYNDKKQKYIVDSYGTINS
jgi:hypothetical protein